MEEKAVYDVNGHPSLDPSPEGEGSVSRGQWAILELFGHKVVGGYMSLDDRFGAPMVRLDVPETTKFPAYTRHYHPNAIYSITYVSENAARGTADSQQENPVTVYVPDLSELTRLREENKRMRSHIDSLINAARGNYLVDGEEGCDVPF